MSGHMCSFYNSVWLYIHIPVLIQIQYTVQCNTQCSAIHSAVQSTVKFSTLKCTCTMTLPSGMRKHSLTRDQRSGQLPALLVTGVSLHWTAMNCTLLPCIVLHCTALYCTALHLISLHCTALHCTAPSYASLLYTTVHSVHRLLHWGLDNDTK